MYEADLHFPLKKKQPIIFNEDGMSLDERVCAGVMGPVDMDQFGDRQTDFAVWDMTDVESGEFQVKRQKS